MTPKDEGFVSKAKILLVPEKGGQCAFGLICTSGCVRRTNGNSRVSMSCKRNSHFSGYLYLV